MYGAERELAGAAARPVAGTPADPRYVMLAPATPGAAEWFDAALQRALRLGRPDNLDVMLRARSVAIRAAYAFGDWPPVR